MMPHDPALGPWEKLGIDMFEFNGKQYLLVADYFSRFPIVRELSDMTANRVIAILKHCFQSMAFLDR